MATINWSPLSETGINSILYSDSFINIFEGAVRSSKTVCSEIAWLNFMEQSPHREFLMTGKTADTLFRNVLGGDLGIINILGKKRARYKKSSEGGAKLVIKFGKVTKICYCIGANDERAEGNIRGMTIGGWYADEITLYPESFVKQAINRMSLDGARAFWTTNPDSPYHPIKVDYIDQAKAKGYRVFHFTLDDNLALSQAYKDNVKMAYSGLWYKRMILGLWVMADGSIYDMFDEQRNVKSIESDDYDRLFVSIDYGIQNPMTYGLYGVKGEHYHLKDYYYHSGRDSGRQKTDGQYADDLEKFIGDKPVKYIVVDPSATSFIAEINSREFFRARGIRVIPAKNDVLIGIRLMSAKLQTGDFTVEPHCKEDRKEFSVYVWDAKAAKRGLDEPLKENDHCMDRNRYAVLTDSIVYRNRTNYSGKGART